VTLQLVEEAVAAGSRRGPACRVLGVSVRTAERWQSRGIEDGRRGPNTMPANALSASEREAFVEAANSPEFRDLSPHQIVPRLADRGVYLGSESTLFRLLRQRDMVHHRGRSKAPASRCLKEHVATGPHQLWSWDITYLRSSLRGAFYYLYLVLDVWSRKIVAWEVHEREDDALSSELIAATARELGVNLSGLVLHSDNGGPMKGATMVATLERLGILPSFSRPRVSDDNPYSEALFRTLKYWPEYPTHPFESLEEARSWVQAFVHWYNVEHRHSAIRYVTPAERHEGLDVNILAKRRALYESVRQLHPDRWSGQSRDWSPPESVSLHPGRRQATTAAPAAVLNATELEHRPSHPKGRSEAKEARPSALTGSARKLHHSSAEVIAA